MKRYRLEVSGDFACFTRPEMKVERVSYDLITPSASRAILESILWKPAIHWHVRAIEVLRPVRWINLRRNEIGGTISARTVATAMRAGTGDLGLCIEDERQQRAGLFLRDVAYRIHADLEVEPAPHSPNSATKYQQMFERRAAKGQCINQPYLGCREFAAAFRLVVDGEAGAEPIDETRDLGFMLYDLDFTNPTDPRPRFFRARLEQGVLRVPRWDSEEVRG